jgi:catechol 2,3-dioxygenase-like lactoylglutathione lyase family enzyme
MPLCRNELTMPILGIDHVQLAMPSGGEDKAREFYSGLLGIPEVPKPPNLASRGGCWFESGDLKVHLGVEPGFQPARKAHPAFLVDDLDEMTGLITRAGLPVHQVEPLEGYNRIQCSDPFGNRLELMEKLPSGSEAVNEIRCR